MSATPLQYALLTPWIEHAAAQPRSGRAFAVVAISGVTAAATTGLYAGIGHHAAIASVGPSGVVLITQFIFFWLLSAALINWGASLMKKAPQPSALLAATAVCYPILFVDAVLTLVRMVLIDMGQSALSDSAGWLALPILLWFATATMVAVARVYRVDLANALALTLLPYAAMCALLVLLALIGVVLSATAPAR